jgi:hypothetical protein
MKNSTKLMIAFILGATFAAPAASAATKYLSVTKIYSAWGSASCPTGWQLTGGGVGALPENYNSSTASTEYVLVGSYPQRQSWNAVARRIEGRQNHDGSWNYSTYKYLPAVYAICAK